MEGRLCEMECSTWPVTNTAIIPNAGKENKGVLKEQIEGILENWTSEW